MRAGYLATAAERARQAGLHNVTTLVVDGGATGLAELAQALRPGGRIVLVNYARYRDADLRAAETLGWKQIAAYSPSPPFFVLVFRP